MLINSYVYDRIYAVLHEHTKEDIRMKQRNIVVIPKSVHKERMIENFNILDFSLSKEEMDAIALLETGKSPIYDDMDLLTVKGIGLHKIHE